MTAVQIEGEQIEEADNLEGDAADHYGLGKSLQQEAAADGESMAVGRNIEGKRRSQKGSKGANRIGGGLADTEEPAEAAEIAEPGEVGMATARHRNDQVAAADWVARMAETSRCRGFVRSEEGAHFFERIATVAVVLTDGEKRGDPSQCRLGIQKDSVAEMELEAG